MECTRLSFTKNELMKQFPVQKKISHHEHSHSPIFHPATTTRCKQSFCHSPLPKRMNCADSGHSCTRHLVCISLSPPGRRSAPVLGHGGRGVRPLADAGVVQPGQVAPRIALGFVAGGPDLTSRADLRAVQYQLGTSRDPGIRDRPFHCGVCR